MAKKENEVTIIVNVDSNIDELLKKAEQFNSLMKEAKTLSDKLASFSLELNLKRGKTMAKKEVFKSLEIDVEKDIYKVNGRDVSSSAKALSLEFENGDWSLLITEDTLFNTSDQSG